MKRKSSLFGVIIFVIYFSLTHFKHAYAVEGIMVQDSTLTYIRNIGADTILVFEEGCIGCELTSNATRSNFKIYLYILKNSTFLINADGSFDPILKNKYRSLIDFYYNNRRFFEKQMEYYKRQQKYNLEHPNKQIFQPPSPSHFYYEHVLFIEHVSKFEFSINREFEFNDKGVPRFLKYKWKIKQKEWVEMIRSEIKN